jgi:hypothetical protein
VTWTIAIYIDFDAEDYLETETDPTKKDWNKYEEWDAVKFILEETGI